MKKPMMKPEEMDGGMPPAMGQMGMKGGMMKGGSAAKKILDALGKGGSKKKKGKC